MATEASTAMEGSGYFTTTMMSAAINGTNPAPPPRPRGNPQLETILFAVTSAVTVLGMIGIGSQVDYRVVWKYLKQPRGYLVGVCVQLFIVPLIAWALTEIFQMTQAESLAVLIQGSSPGGSTSNIVVFWMGGIVDLSVAMTATSTILALGAMPFWLYIFSLVSTLSDDLNIPFSNLGITLAIFLPPILVGMLVHWYFSPKVSLIISKVLIAVGSVGILIITIVGSVIRNIVWVVTWRVGVVCAILPLIGFVFGYAVTRLPFLHLSRRCGRTVAAEVALQNVQVASAVIQQSFTATPQLIGLMIVVPFLYIVFQIGYSVMFIGLYALLRRKYGWFADDEQEALEERMIKEDKERRLSDLKKKKKKGENGASLSSVAAATATANPGFVDDDDEGKVVVHRF